MSWKKETGKKDSHFSLKSCKNVLEFMVLKSVISRTYFCALWSPRRCKMLSLVKEIIYFIYSKDKKYSKLHIYSFQRQIMPYNKKKTLACTNIWEPLHYKNCIKVFCYLKTIDLNSLVLWLKYPGSLVRDNSRKA